MRKRFAFLAILVLVLAPRSGSAEPIVVSVGPLGPNQPGFRLNANALEPAPVPEPATMILLGTGLAGVLAAARRRQRRGAAPPV